MMTGTPNVLFVVTDQQRHDWVGMNPDVPVRTPTFERLADRGVWFRNAVCPSPWCAPSRTAVASGHRYRNLPTESYDDEAFPVAEHPTYAARLRDEAGYHTAGCGKFLDKFFPDRGLDGKNRIGEFGYVDGVNSLGKWAGTGTAGEPAGPYQAYLEREVLAAAHYEDYRRRTDDELSDPLGTMAAFTATDPTPLPEAAYIDNWIGRRGLQLLRDAPDGPWHIEVSFASPHDPLDVTEEMYGWYRDPDVAFPSPVEPAGDLDEETHQEVRRNYAAACENVDRWLGRYVDELERRGDLDETLVVVTSDHGEMLGDHGRWKKHSPYQPSLGVPLVVAGPGVEPRGPVDAPTTTLDLHATFLDYAGLSTRADSRSLGPLLAGGDPRRECVTAGSGPWQVVFDGRFKLVSGYDPEPRPQYDFVNGDRDQFKAFRDSDESLAAVRERRPTLLFDLENDPAETRNVADQHPETVAELAERLPA
jgi:arylsulfatase A-like enzyme